MVCNPTYSGCETTIREFHPKQFQAVGLSSFNNQILVSRINETAAASYYDPVGLSFQLINSKFFKLDKSIISNTFTQGGRSCAKSLDSDENFRPEHTLFCRKLRFVVIYALVGDLWAKKVPFWVKNSVSWARSALLHGIYIAYFTELILQI